MPLHELTIADAHSRLVSGEISARELAVAVLDRIEAVDGDIGAYLTVTADRALAAADAADKTIAEGRATPLTGIPIGIKDLICTRGVPTTCASNVLSNFVPPYDATVARRLSDAGAVMVGKLNMDEFAMGSSNENSAMQITRNPWDLDRVPGGSSGGSAAAVAAEMCLGALGSDTGGSIRQPASHCGVVGIKPTYGRVSRFGLVAFASSLDQIGPLTRTTRDSALMLNAICGHDPADSTSVREPVPDFTDGLDRPLAGLTVGIVDEFNRAEGLDPEVAAAFQASVAILKSLGVKCVPVQLPHTKYAVAAYYVIAPCEASSNLARYDGVKYGLRDPDADGLLTMYRQTRSGGFGPEVQRRIVIGTYCLSAGYYDAYYGKASQVRTRIIQDYKAAFAHCDALISPVAPTPAFKIGENVDDPLTMYLSDIFTLSANLAGVPGISVPCGYTDSGLPMGLQVLGRHFDEATLLRVAHQFELATVDQRRQPSLAVSPSRG